MEVIRPAGMVTPLIAHVPISEIFVDEEFNCRGFIAPIDVVDMAKDIERQGLVCPVLVVQLNPPVNGKKFKLLAGFRRTKAHVVLKRETIMAVVRQDKISDQDARIINIAENLHRKDLSVLQEAKAIGHLFATMTELEIMTRLGQSRGWVQIRGMLLKLPAEVQKEVEAGMVNQVNIRELYAIHRKGNIEKLYEAVKDLKEKKLSGKKAITVNPNIVGVDAVNKRLRSKKEILGLLTALVDKKILGLHGRCLAWAAGTITMEELLADIVEHTTNHGLEYVPFTNEEVAAICER